MSRPVLSVHARPRTFADMIGQEKVTQGITKLVKSGAIPQAWCFTGPAGSGKTTLANIIARSYQEGVPGKNFGNPSPDVDTSSIFDVNAADFNGVDDMRQLIEQASYVPPPPALYRVVILEEAHALTTQAQTALLRPLENPAKHQVWMLCTTDQGKLSGPLQRRLTQIAMAPLTDDSRMALALHLKKLAGTDAKVKPFVRKANELDITSSGVFTAAFEAWVNGLGLNRAFTDGRDAAAIDIVRAIVNQTNWPGNDLKAMTADQLRQLRLLCLSYLRSMLCGNGKMKVADAITLMAEPLPYEDLAVQATIIARLYQVGGILGSD